MSAERRRLLDIGLRQVSLYRPVLCVSHPVDLRGLHQVVASPCRSFTAGFVRKSYLDPEMQRAFSGTRVGFTKILTLPSTPVKEPSGSSHLMIFSLKKEVFQRSVFRYAFAASEPPEPL